VSEQSTPGTELVERLPLKLLGLRTGMALQTRRLVKGATKAEAQFYGAIESKGVMVGPLGPDGQSTGLTEGEVCVVRGFTGQLEFSFISKVLQTFEKPFAYAHLADPPQVDCRAVRQSLRTATSWPCQLWTGEPSGIAELAAVDGQLVDISMAGAMVKAPSPVGPIGGAITLTISAEIEGEPLPITVAARICHNNPAGEDGQFCIGMAFGATTQQAKLALHYLTQTPRN
jgi:hypothetical protein